VLKEIANGIAAAMRIHKLADVRTTTASAESISRCFDALCDNG
jgi:hypothetical protein